MTFTFLSFALNKPKIKVFMMKCANLKFILLGLVLLPSLSSAAKQGEVGETQDIYYGILLPKVIAGFSRGTPIDNEISKPGLGVTIPYSTPGTKVTLYVYDFQLENIVEGPESEVVVAHFRETLNNVGQALSW